MRRSIEDDLDGLAQRAFAPPLDGLEDQVWARIQAKKAAAGTGSIAVRATLTLAALTVGLVFGALHPSARPTHLSEMGVLSEDGAFAPSVRLGG